MPRGVSITILSENTVRNKGLIAEHGISYWIESGKHKILFDTGQGFAFPHNAHALKVNLSQANAIVLSHGHYDHVGGLEFAVKQTRAPIFLHPAALQQKFLQYKNGQIKKVSIPFLDRGGKKHLGKRLRLITTSTEIIPGIFATGEIPRITKFEDTGGAFYLDKKAHTPDPLLDDQALFFDTPKGIVVLLGCAHAGVINTLLYIRKLTKDRPIHAVIGGMHLANASPQRIAKTIQTFKQLKIQKLIPAHCTGIYVIPLLQKTFPKTYSPCSAGMSFSF
ncbi:MAG: MBL fold metallo-hydrolase [Verrucomicrobiota bacterium]